MALFEAEGRLAFIHRLTGSAAEAAVLLDGATMVSLAPGQRLSEHGGRPQALSVVCDGVVKAYRSVSEGRTQTLSLFVPGDFVDLHAFLLGAAMTSIGAVTRARLLQIPLGNVEEAIERAPFTLRSLARLAAREQARLQEQVIGMGRRSAVAQTAHVLCELSHRMSPAKAYAAASELPFTQAELADILGLSLVHVSRVLQQLRQERLVELHRGRLRILERGRLVERAQFDPSYLET